MKKPQRLIISLILFLLIDCITVFATPSPDQFLEIYSADSLLAYAETIHNLTKSNSGASLVLEEGAKDGFIILNEFTFQYPFNRGLPSWNGSAPNDQSSGFKVEMRFIIDEQWTDWLMVGYWENYFWGRYGKTTFADGEINVDYVELNKYATTFQYKVIFERNKASYETPHLQGLSFSVSDSKTTVDIDEIVNDSPQAFYIPTHFLYQYAIDNDIGGSICSPTTVSMIIKSFDIDVDPLEFAERTYDSYWGMFGVWPRVVTHASEYGLRGAVTRYRTWSDAFEVMQNGGRIAMSVGEPLYTGHLIMLAGFDDEGTPIVHDPARTYGEGHKYSKRSLSKSWFNKGGISYTFYKSEIFADIWDNKPKQLSIAVFPNPVREEAHIQFNLRKVQHVQLQIFDLHGRLIKTLTNTKLPSGDQSFTWNPKSNGVTDGIYIVRLVVEEQVYTSKIVVN